MTKKYKLIGGSSMQNGGHGFTVRMPLLTPTISVMSPMLPSVPQSVVPSVGPLSPFSMMQLSKMGPSINIFPENKIIRFLRNAERAKRELSPMSDENNLPKNLTESEGNEIWYMGTNLINKSALVNVVNNTKRYYTGAGALLLEIDSTTNKHCVVLISVNMGGTQIYQDCGGLIDTFSGKTTLKNTAQRELAEETRNLFNLSDSLDIDARTNNYIDLLEYRCYILPFKNNITISTEFGNNKAIIDASNLGRAWRESVEIDKFYVDDIKVCLQQQSINKTRMCRNIAGVTKEIRGRTINILNKLLDASNLEKYNSLVQNPLPISMKNNNTRTDALQTTKTVLIG